MSSGSRRGLDIIVIGQNSEQDSWWLLTIPCPSTLPLTFGQYGKAWQYGCLNGIKIIGNSKWTSVGVWVMGWYLNCLRTTWCQCDHMPCFHSLTLNSTRQLWGRYTSMGKRLVSARTTDLLQCSRMTPPKVRHRIPKTTWEIVKRLHLPLKSIGLQLTGKDCLMHHLRWCPPLVTRWQVGHVGFCLCQKGVNMPLPMLTQPLGCC